MSQPTPPTRPATATEWRIDEVLMPGNFSPLHAVFTGMRAISLILGILAALGLLLGMIPFFGWLNWIFVLPPAVLGVIFGALSRDRSATTLSAVVAGVALVRLMLGGGVL